ncbi:hypothetical protein DIPPA_04314 [Diplonema papillatum]|nr:hypothetical protein DIPPA_04314 [Diplonema papillatum]
MKTVPALAALAALACLWAPALGAEFCASGADFALQGQACSNTVPCVNVNLNMGDTALYYEDDRHGLDLGLFCLPNQPETAAGDGICTERLPHGAPCAGGQYCKSWRCGYADTESRTRGLRTCIEDGDIGLFRTCPATTMGGLLSTLTDLDHLACEGKLCWPEASAVISDAGGQLTTCREFAKIDQPCEILWDPAGGSVVQTDTCDPEEGDGVMFTERLSYCQPNDPDFRPPVNPSLISEIISSGVCRSVADRDEGEDCTAYQQSETRPNCGWGHYCSVTALAAQTEEAVCKEWGGSGDECPVNTTGQCEHDYTCNYRKTSENTEPGSCEKRFDRAPGEQASKKELCELEEDLMVYFAPGNVANNFAGSCKAAPYATCTVDADCQPTDGETVVPVFCDTTSNTCKPVIPYDCRDEWYAFQNWVLEGGRQKSEFSLSIRESIAHRRVESLACCLHSNAEGCMRFGDYLRIGDMSGLSSVVLPVFMRTIQILELEGNGADICSSSGMDVFVIVILVLLGVFLLSMCALILIREYVCRPPEKVKGDDASSSSGGGPAGKREIVPPPAVVEKAPDAAPPQSNNSAHEPTNGHGHAGGSSPTHNASVSGKPFAENTSVVVWYDGDKDGYHGWFDATVIDYDEATNTYTVRYTTNELSPGVAASSVRLKLTEDMENDSRPTDVA